MAVGKEPWPVGVLTGFLGSGKTTLVRRLLRQPGMGDTLVVVQEFGAVGLDHHLVEAADGGVILLPGGCICCVVRQDLARTLHDVAMRWLAGTLPHFSRVIVETSGLAEPASVVNTLASHPLVCDRFAVRCVTTLVDAEHGETMLERQAIGRRQVVAADHVLLTKLDRAEPAAAAALTARLHDMNPIAEFGTARFGDCAFDAVFAAPSGVRMNGRSNRWLVGECGGPLDTIQSVTLQQETELPWRAVQSWIANLLERCGPSLLRLKSILNIAGQQEPIVLHAIHETFYPVQTLAAWRDDRPCSTLVLIFEGHPPEGLAEAFARIGFQGREGQLS